MSIFETILWYIDNIIGYCVQMMPCMFAGLIGFILIYRFRQNRLNQYGLVSSTARELVLLFFVLFCSGLISLTLFPANLWSYILDRLLYPDEWYTMWNGYTLGNFYPDYREVISGIRDISDILHPLQEITRALRYRHPWLMFMMLGNIVMFMPIGFFVSFLWRGWGWWKIGGLGLLISCVIEFIQFFIRRSTDIDDVILNTTGTMFGFWFLCLCRLAFPNWVKQFQCSPKGKVLV